MNLKIGELTLEKIELYSQYEKEKGTSNYNLQRYKSQITSLYSWLSEDKLLTKEKLVNWRAEMIQRGYSSTTILNYVKAINRYLDFAGLSHIRFERGRFKNIEGCVFGYLTAVKPTKERYRTDVVWECICRCGNTFYVPATRLISGNTLSCGCLSFSYLKDANKYIDNTSLRQALDDHIESKRSKSGYTGIIQKGTKWAASITYKKKRYNLGYYAKLEDAIRARSEAKQRVIDDAENLLNIYMKAHPPDNEKPDRAKICKYNFAYESQNEGHGGCVIRNNNTSGYTGVSQKRNKWMAKITYCKKTYILGYFDVIEDAVSARKCAEDKIAQDPDLFLNDYSEVHFDERQKSKSNAG